MFARLCHSEEPIEEAESATEAWFRYLRRTYPDLNNNRYDVNCDNWFRAFISSRWTINGEPDIVGMFTSTERYNSQIAASGELAVNIIRLGRDIIVPCPVAGHTTLLTNRERENTSLERIVLFPRHFENPQFLQDCLRLWCADIDQFSQITHQCYNVDRGNNIPDPLSCYNFVQRGPRRFIQLPPLLFIDLPPSKLPSGFEITEPINVGRYII